MDKYHQQCVFHLHRLHNHQNMAIFMFVGIGVKLVGGGWGWWASLMISATLQHVYYPQ